MKHFAASALLLISAQAVLAQAQNVPVRGESIADRAETASEPSRASLGASIFYVLMSGSSENYSPGHWAVALQDRSITPEEDRRLWAYARQARDTNLAFQRGEMNKLCADGDSLTTIDAVAAALTEFDEKNAANINNLGNEAPKSLSDKLGKLLTAAGQNSTFLVLETDHKQVMLSKDKEPIAHINAVCAK